VILQRDYVAADGRARKIDVARLEEGCPPIPTIMHSLGIVDKRRRVFDA